MHSSKNRSAFYAQDGGLLSDDKDELYFIGIIDILQPWTLRKVMEAKMKSLVFKRVLLSALLTTPHHTSPHHTSPHLNITHICFLKETLSAIEPPSYSKRLQEFMKGKVT